MHSEFTFHEMLIDNPPPPSLEEHQAAKMIQLSCFLVFWMLSAAKLSLHAVCYKDVSAHCLLQSCLTVLVDIKFPSFGPILVRPGQQ